MASTAEKFGDASRAAMEVMTAVDDMFQIGRAIGADDPCNPINIFPNSPLL